MLSGDSTQFGAVRLGLRPKFIGAFAAVTIVMAIIIVSAVQWRVRRASDDQTRAQGQTVADTVKATAGYYVMFGLVDNHRQADAVARQLLSAEIGVTLLALAIAVALAYLAARLIVRPMVDLAKSAQLIAKGDLTQRTAVTSGDEIGSLAETFNAMSGDLEKTMTKLVRAQTQLKSVADTVGSRSHTVIERVDEQRSVLDEAYQSIDQLNGGVRKITDNVETLSASSEETSSSMLEMVASMEEVSRHTDSLFSSVEETASATHQMVASINEVDQNVVYLTNFVTDTSSSMVEMSASIAEVEANAAKSYDVALAVADA